MIVITIAGESSRFFEKGYTEAKYKLGLFNGKPILWHILSYLNRQERIVLVANKAFNDRSWLCDLISALGFNNFDIVEIGVTDGQMTSAVQGITRSKFYDDDLAREPVVIFNGDTVRHIPFDLNMNDADGLIEVFHMSGDHWSFVDRLGDVAVVKEKERISNLCSTGLYGFSSVGLFLDYSKRSRLIKEERYIAPLYNELIRDGLKVKSFLSERESFTLCGTPQEYEDAVKRALRK